MVRKFPLISGLLLGSVIGVANAGACSYREGIVALEQGNEVRGMALLRMASRDGDRRAAQYLARFTGTERLVTAQAGEDEPERVVRSGLVAAQGRQM